MRAHAGHRRAILGPIHRASPGVTSRIPPRRSNGPAACQALAWQWRSVSFMTAAQPTEEPYEVIHIGEHAAAVVPVDELRRLRAIARHASAEAVEAAELEEAAEIRRQTDEWIAAGRPGAVSHEAFRKVLLGEVGA